LIGEVAAHSAPGARVATYSVAGDVRRALIDAGFEVAKRPGFGAKRERLEARWPGEPAPDLSAASVAIVGAGIAGAALARAFRGEGVEPRLFEAASPGAGASGNPSALVTARLDAGLGPAARLHAQALDRARRLFEGLDGAVIARGVLQLEGAERDHARFAKIAASDLFEPGALQPLSAEAVSAALGEPAPAALRMADALVIEPAVALRAWLGAVERARITRVEATDGGWRLWDAEARLVAETGILCLAAGADLAALWPDAPILPVRGQLTWAAGLTTPAAAWSAYAAPSRGGMVFGATFDRGQTDDGWRAEDDARNLKALAARLPALANRIRGTALNGRASIRATARDHLPLAGVIGPRLFVLGGLGSRGFALAPVLGEHVAALAIGSPSPLPIDLQRIVAPERFADRPSRRAPTLAAGAKVI